MNKKEKIFSNEAFEAICEFVNGEGSFGYDRDNCYDHIIGNHFLSREGVIARMKAEHKRVCSAFKNVTFEEVEDLFFDMGEQIGHSAYHSTRSYGYVEVILPWDSSKGFSLSYKGRGTYEENPCNKICIPVYWVKTLFDGEDHITAVRIDNAFPINTEVDTYMRYQK
jgi:hypothetical protein